VLLLAFGTSLERAQKEILTLSTKTKYFVAGNEIKIQFSSESKTTNPQLYIIHSYGKTLLEGTYKYGNYHLYFPKFTLKNRYSILVFNC
jgi:hypothetical protein